MRFWRIVGGVNVFTHDRFHFRFHSVTRFTSEQLRTLTNLCMEFYITNGNITHSTDCLLTDLSPSVRLAPIPVRQHSSLDQWNYRQPWTNPHWNSPIRYRWIHSRQRRPTGRLQTMQQFDAGHSTSPLYHASLHVIIQYLGCMQKKKCKLTV